VATIRVKVGRYRVTRGTLHHADLGEVREGAEVDLSYEDAALALQANVVEYVGESAPEDPPEAHRLAVESRRQRDEDAIAFRATAPPAEPEAPKMTKAQRKAAAKAAASEPLPPSADPFASDPEAGLTDASPAD